MSQPSPLLPARQRAHALVAAGDLAGALAVLEHAVELGKVRLSEGDPDVLRTAYELAVVLQRVDEPAGARRVLEEAYAAGVWRLGEFDPLMLEISAGIGVAADELGNRHEARKAFARVAEYGPRVLGGDHWAVARARAYLGHDQNPVPVRVDAVPQPQGAPPRPNPLAQSLEAVVPRAEDEPTVQLPILAAEGAAEALDEPTAQLQVVAPAARRSTVEPPSAANLQVWVPPARVVDEPTDEQPVISRRMGGGTGELRGGRWAYGKIVFVVVVVLAVVGVALAFVYRSRDAGPESDVPNLGGAAPGDVLLRDSGAEIGLSWRDPSKGTVSFMVTMGKPGELLKPVAALGPGTTSYSLGGLSSNLNYCFTVAAVYRQDEFATSPQVCTSRASTTPR